MFGAAVFGLLPGLSLPFPTTEILPVELDKSSFVRTFLGFFASVEAVESCDFEAGGVLGSVVCASAEKAMQRSAKVDKQMERSKRTSNPSRIED